VRRKLVPQGRIEISRRQLLAGGALALVLGIIGCGSDDNAPNIDGDPGGGDGDPGGGDGDPGGGDGDPGGGDGDNGPGGTEPSDF
jgi:hypothetical protein